MKALDDSPAVAPDHLDELWFQVAGTLCNLTCAHCFISCSPHNDRYGFLSLAQVRDYLRQSVELGVKEYYFTGGEPFLNRDFVPIVRETLRLGAVTVLTNATVLKDEWLLELAEAERTSIYSLEFRVSLDGFDSQTNDPIRGTGTFDRTVVGLLKLVQHGFLPIVTAARTWPDDQESRVVGKFVEMLRRHGYARPRLKILPAIQLGAEVIRTGPYDPRARVTEAMLTTFDISQLICQHSRVVSDRGVHVCPILLDSPDALLADNLRDALVPYRVAHGACFTCYQYGAICTNPSSDSRRATGR